MAHDFPTILGSFTSPSMHLKTTLFFKTLSATFKATILLIKAPMEIFSTMKHFSEMILSVGSGTNFIDNIVTTGTLGEKWFLINGKYELMAPQHESKTWFFFTHWTHLRSYFFGWDAWLWGLIAKPANLSWACWDIGQGDYKFNSIGRIMVTFWGRWGWSSAPNDLSQEFWGAQKWFRSFIILQWFVWCSLMFTLCLHGRRGISLRILLGFTGCCWLVYEGP